MAFPDTSSGVYLLYMSAAEGMLFKKELLSSIKKQFLPFFPTQIEESDSSIRFFSRSSLFRYEYQVSIQVEVAEDKTTIRYEYGTQYLVAYLFIAVLVSLVFSKMIFGLGFFSSIFLILLVYFIANHHIRSQIKRLLRSCSSLFNEGQDVSSEMIRLQGEWARCDDVCPACGAKKTIYDRVCFQCGLKLSDTAKPHPSNSTAKGQKRLNYFVKSNKK